MARGSPRARSAIEEAAPTRLGAAFRSLGKQVLGIGAGRRRQKGATHRGRRSRLECLEDRSLLDADCFRISEYMTVNRSTLWDADGDASDWIEIENTCSASANLAGWKLSDGESNPWTFPDRSVAGGGRLVVFASGKDRAGADLHASFGLENDDLTLRSPAGAIVSQYTTLSSSQVADVSYGIGLLGTHGFLAAPTPGSPNVAALSGLLSRPIVDVYCGPNNTPLYGVFVDTLACAPTIHMSASRGTIYYTTDGSEPGPQNPASAVYAAPLTGFTDVTLRAAAFEPGWVRSAVVTRTILSAAGVAAQSEMDADVIGPNDLFGGRYAGRFEFGLYQFPTFALTVAPDELFGAEGIHTKFAERGRESERFANIESGGCSFGSCAGYYPFNISAGVRIDDVTNASLEKKSFRLAFRSEYDTGELPSDVFDDGGRDFEDVLLVAAEADAWQNPVAGDAAAATYLRNELLRRLGRDLGLPVSHSRYVHLYLNGSYWGVYRLVEQVTEEFAAHALDVRSPCDGSQGCVDVLEAGSGGQAKVVAGDRSAWDQLMQLASGESLSDASYDAIAQLVDVDAFIDYMLLYFYAGANDWLPDNWHAIRDRSPGGRFKFVVGHAEGGFRNLQADVTSVRGDDSPGTLFRSLATNERFRWRFVDRARQRLDIGSTFGNLVLDRSIALQASMDDALIAEAARWGDARREATFTPDVEWLREIDWLWRSYVPSRALVLREQLGNLGLYSDVPPPVFNATGGVVIDAFDVRMAAREGTVFYTVDGSDPRLSTIPTGGASVLPYGGPVTIAGPTVVRAAAFDRGRWSAVAEATFGVSKSAFSALRVSEIHYHPSNPTEAEDDAGFDDDDDFEFVELVNISDEAIDLGEVRIRGGISFDFAHGSVATLAPKSYVVVVRNRAAFDERYGASTAVVAGEYDGDLGNGGGSLRLETVSGAAILDFRYDDVWWISTDGSGYSLEKKSLCAPKSSWSNPSAWIASVAHGGSPGARSSLPGDFDDDGRVTLADLAVLKAHMGGVGDPRYNLDGDLSDRVDAGDVAVFASFFGSEGQSACEAPPVDPTPPSSPNAYSWDPWPPVVRWTPASDVESGISAYRVYRDGLLIASVGGTSFVDQDATSAFAHAYEVSAVNGAGVEGMRSAPLMITPLDVVAAEGVDTNYVRVTFSTEINAQSGANPANFRIDGLSVFSSQVLADGRSVLLATSPRAPAFPYWLHVAGVVSAAGVPIVPGSEVRFSWGDTPVEQTPPQVVEVLLANSAWTVGTLAALAADGHGDGGVTIWQAGAATAGNVSWSAIDTVHVRFDEQVDVGLGDLRVDGVDVGHYDVADFAYDPFLRQATWRLRHPVDVDRLNIEVAVTTRDLSGNLLSPHEPIAIGVLPGDLNGDGRVDRADLAALLAGAFASSTDAQYDPLADVNGNGRVGAGDAIALRNHFAATLPSRDVVISEFMALNNTRLADEDGERSDWIELHNLGVSPIDLGGWFLTDDPNDLARWRLSDVVLAPGERTIVFASGKDRRLSGAELHTDFGLSSQGGYVALVLPDGETVASEFTYPQQFADVSYGRNGVGSRERYYAAPTPGGENPPENTVRVTEFMASNHATLADEDGDFADWIEVYNAGPTAEHMSGWSLSDGGAPWLFAPINLAVGEYRVIFASGEDRRDPDGELHATFRLSRSGEDVILTQPDGNVANAFSAYPAQRDDISFGLSSDFNQQRFFTHPTPGEANLTGFDGVLFSVPHGFYDQTFDVELSSEIPGAAIHYTTDGSTPTATHGSDYSSPIRIGSTTTLRAVAYDGNTAHLVSTQTYVFLDDVLAQSGEGSPDTWGVFADYGMDPELVAQIGTDTWKNEVFRALPSLSLVMSADDLFLAERGIYAHPQMEGPEWERTGSLERIDTNTAGLGFAANGTVRIVGQPYTRVSEEMVAQPKLSFGVRFDAPVTLNISDDHLFPASPAERISSVYLRAGFQDSWTGSDYEQWLRALYGRDEWMRQAQRDMGQPAVAGRFVHLYVNGLYWGVYNATEEPSGEFAAARYAGDAAEFDVVGGSAAGSATGAAAIAGDPTLAAWNELTELIHADLSEAAAYDAVAALVDIDNLIDYLLLDLYAYAGSTDVSVATKDPGLGWFAVRPRSDGEKFQFFAWDNEVILGEGLENYLQDRAADQPGSHAAATLDPYVMLDALERNVEFVQRFVDRAYLHLSEGGALSADAAIERWVAIAETLAPTASAAGASGASSPSPGSPPADLSPLAPLNAEAARWGRHRRGFGDADSWETRPPDPDANPPPPPPPPPPAGFGPEDAFQRDQQLRERATVLLGQLREAGLASPLSAPTVSLQSTPSAGSTSPTPAGSPASSPTGGSVLTISASTGAVYYTLDGSDPRLPGGSVAPSARLYTSPVLVDRNVLLTVRARSGADWSAVVVRPLIVEGAAPLRITEVMYHPADPPAGSPYTDDDFEFLELTNVGDEPVSLLGMRFAEGIEFDFAASRITTLAPQQRIVLVKNESAFASRYDASTIPIAGEYGGLMNNGDDDLRIVDAFGQTVAQLSYSDAWYPLTDGPGFSLIALDEATLPAEISPRAGWRDRLAVGQYAGGTPGAAETTAPGSVVISEVYAASTPSDALGDWIELTNTTDFDIDVGGWYLSDNGGALKKFKIPANSILPARGYLTFYEDDPRPSFALDFGLKQGGDDVFLTSADAAGDLGGHREQVSFGAAADGRSLGRYVNADGGVDIVPLLSPTPGAANAEPRVGPVVLSEIMYAPYSAIGAPMEFVELLNGGPLTVTLDGWSLGGGIDFFFPAGTTLAPGNTLVVAGGDPGEFRTQYAVDASTAVVGPFGGRLNNGGERVALYDALGVAVDAARYDNESPWPMLADEYGASLERRSATDYGNASRSWQTSPRGGTPGVVNGAAPDAPQPFPYTATFDIADLFGLAGWNLSVTNPAEAGGELHPATWSVMPDGSPAAGSALSARQIGEGRSEQRAVLALDLSAVEGATDLVLDFQLRRFGTESGENDVQLFVSGDGIGWQPAGLPLAPPTQQWLHYVADLDALLADAGVAIDGDVFLQFRHRGLAAGDGISLDDVRVSNLDLVGPRVVGFLPADGVAGPVDHVTVTFDEAVDEATFSTDDVSIRGPTGEAIAATAVQTADGRTWTIAFAAEQIAGVYVVRIGPDIRDSLGNAMDSATSIGGGAFEGRFQVAATAGSTPLGETFDAGDFTDLTAWSFDAESGFWRLAAPIGGNSAGMELRTENAGGAAGSSYAAVLKLDLSTRNPTAALGLRFDLWRSAASGADGGSATLWASGDGRDWRFVEGLTSVDATAGSGASGVTTPFGFDLPTVLSRADVAWDADVWLRFSFATADAEHSFALDNVRVDALDVTGPQVLGWIEGATAAAPLAQIEVTFDTAIDAATFTPQAVRIRDPFGAAFAPQTIVSSDGRTWTIAFAPQTVAGRYQLALSPALRDLAGISLNQDGDSVAGEVEDAFVGTIDVGPAQAMPIAYVEDFEGAGGAVLDGWSIYADPRSAWELTNDESPWLGDRHFVARTHTAGSGASVQEAILHLDLSTVAGAEDVYLEFWAKQIGADSLANVSRLFVSGDEEQWYWVPEFAPPVGRYTHYAFDVDALARQHAIADDGDVYFRFQHQAERVGDGLAIDAVRADRGDASGPRVVSYGDVIVADGLATFDVTFDRPIDASSFEPQHVVIYVGQRAVSEDVNLNASAILARDDRTFTIAFAPPALGGAYTLSISTDVTDTNGIPLNQNADAVAASLAGDDLFSTVFVVDQPGQRAPYAQDFESRSFADLSGWSFRVMGDFEYGANTWEFSKPSTPEGGYRLVATQLWDCWTDHEAILKLDLADQFGATDLELEFYLEFLARDNPNIPDRRSARVFVRGEADEAWIDVTGTLDPPEGVATRFTVDLDAALAAHGIAMDDDVYVMFNRRGFHKRSAIALDDVGVRRIGEAPSPVAAAALATVRRENGAAGEAAVLAVGQLRRADGAAVDRALATRPNHAPSQQEPDGARLVARRRGTPSNTERAHDRAFAAW